jgi:phosphoribosyl 1,2-cyclic phosphate phosphodiesterase
MLNNGIQSVDGVLYTHDHADHVHGIDDLRAISIRRTGELPVYGPADCLDRIKKKFGYIFDEGTAPRKGTSIPELGMHALEPGVSVTVAGIEVRPIEVSHGFGLVVYGYRFGEIAYLTDAKDIPDESLNALKGVRRLVINGLFQHPHPTHLSIPEACEIGSKVGAERTYLTHLTHETGHEELLDSLPDGVEPAYDGLIIDL